MPRRIRTQTFESDILNLRAKGLSYNKIASILQCSKSTISYWLDPNGREKVVRRNKKNKGKYNGRWASKRGAIWKYNYLLDKSCEKCGESDMRKLQFDHKKRYKKSSNITNLLNGSLRILDNEAKKCRVLCANCHQVKTLKENNSAFYRVYQEKEQVRKKNGCKR
tara:strand:- start:282 stop:776 length:495 start_codon:yes stop_codon:yes gene_type:complete